MREVLYSQINDFNPAAIIVSYSGKLHIENRHFVEIMKELTKVSNYKVVMFPNLTKSYVFDQLNGSCSEEDAFKQLKYMA